MRGSTDHSDPEEITEGVRNPQEEEEEGEAQSEEALRVKGAVVPELPSHEEREEHMLTHIPYRQWCQHCVSGKAKGNPNHNAKGYVREMPPVVMDYMYMKERQREGEEGGMPI